MALLLKRGSFKAAAICFSLQITKETITFQDIMKCYRSQPQASSHVSNSHRSASAAAAQPALTLCVRVCVQVYRSVLLRHTPREQPADENMEVDCVSGGECKNRC